MFQNPREGTWISVSNKRLTKLSTCYLAWSRLLHFANKQDYKRVGGFFHSFSFLMSFWRSVLFTFSNWPASFFIFLILFSLDITKLSHWRKQLIMDMVDAHFTVSLSGEAAREATLSMLTYAKQADFEIWDFEFSPLEKYSTYFIIYFPYEVLWHCHIWKYLK